MKKTLLILISLFLFDEAKAQKIEKGFFVYDDSTHSELKKFTNNKNVIIDHVSSSGFEIYGVKGLSEELSKMKILFTELNPVSDSFFADYPTAEMITKKMQAIQSQYPQLVTLIEIGKSVEGRPLMFAKLTAPAKRGLKAPSARPEFKYVANMHGDEIVGRELMIRLIEDLAKNYGNDSRITNILDSFQVYIMPSMNPDGAMKHQRSNANGTDLNRSFPDFTTSDNQNTMNRREPEVQAMMKFQAQHHFKLSANFHGGAEVVNYPYDTSADVFPLENLVKTISLNYARKISYFWNSREFERGITNGYQWYEVDGGMQDWSYHWHGDLQVTIELTKTKWPNYSNVDRYYQDNRESLLGYIEETATF
jgi:hypothetical protein